MATAAEQAKADELFRQSLGSLTSGLKSNTNIVPTATPSTPYSATKTADQFVPVIGTKVDPVGGGNITEYRGPRTGDDAQMLQAQAPSTPAPPPTPTAQPMSAPQTQQQPAPDYAALAAARTALALQRKTTIANQQKASAQSAFDQQNLRTQDNRTLENAQINRTLSPFSGKTTYDKALIGRERTQADADASAALATQKGNIDALLADYQNATADEQIRIADELERADRQYNLDLAKFNQDQSNSDRNYDQNQQVIDYNQNPNNPSNYGQSLTNALNELKLGNYSAEQKQQAALYEQELKSGKLTNEMAEYNLAQLKDPKSATNLAKQYEAEIKKLELAGLPETQRLELQKLQKTIADIGVVKYKPQTQAEKDYDEQQVLKIKAEIDKIKSGADPKAADYSKDIDRIAGLYVTPGQYGAAPKVNNPSAMRNAIIALGMEDSETDRYLTLYGLPIN